MGHVLARSVARKCRFDRRVPAHRFRLIRALLVAATLASFAFASRSASAQRVVRDINATRIAKFYLYLEAGREYRFETYNIGTTDPVMHLLDSTSMEITQNDDAAPPDRNSRITFAPPTTGAYYVLVRGFSEYSIGMGAVRYQTRVLPWGLWGSWTDLSSSSHFGGTIVEIEPNQKEYRTVKGRPFNTACPDTVLYTMDIGKAITQYGYSDDDGVGYMSRVYRLFTSYPTQYLLVGAWDVHGVTDVIANDIEFDTDLDGLGPALEAEVGTCDSASTPGDCANRINYKDSDHDGLSDDAEVFGVNKSPRSEAAHLWSMGANPRKKDVFFEVDWGAWRTCQVGGSCSKDGDCPTNYLCLSSQCREQSSSPDLCWDPSITSNPFSEWNAALFQGKFGDSNESEIKNMSGEGGGIAMHFDTGNACPGAPLLCGAWGMGGTFTMSEAVHPNRVGLFRHARIDPDAAGQTDSWPGTNTRWGNYSSLMRGPIHEAGHSLGLRHDGHWTWSSVSGWTQEVNCKPNYNSLMNYAFNGDWSTFNFSHGQNSAVVLDPANIQETASPFVVDKTLAARHQYDYPEIGNTGALFPVTDGVNGLIDWNRDNSLPELLAVRGAFVAAGGQCSARTRSRGVDVFTRRALARARPPDWQSEAARARRVRGALQNTPIARSRPRFVAVVASSRAW